MALGSLYCRRLCSTAAHPQPPKPKPSARPSASTPEATSNSTPTKSDALFAKCSAYAQRLFRHSGVVELYSFASRLLDRRRFTGTEAVELLAQLGLR